MAVMPCSIRYLTALHLVQVDDKINVRSEGCSSGACNSFHLVLRQVLSKGEGEGRAGAPEHAPGRLWQG